jgi:hypothetical protein
VPGETIFVGPEEAAALSIENWSTILFRPKGENSVDHKKESGKHSGSFAFPYSRWSAIIGQLRDNLKEYFQVTQYFQSKFRSKGKYLLVRDLIGTDRHEDVNYLFSSSRKKLGLSICLYQGRMTLPFRIEDPFWDKLSKELRCAASELRTQLAKGRVDTTSTDRWFVLRISLIRPTFKPGKYGQASPIPPTVE